MIGRRNLLVGAASLAALDASRARAEQPILTDDGLYKQPWFLESFLDLADDLDQLEPARCELLVSPPASRTEGRQEAAGS